MKLHYPNRCAGIGALAIAVMASAMPVGAEEAPAGISAVWRKQEISFTLFGGGSVYTCGALEQKIRAILLDLGARDDLEVNISACLNEFRRGAAAGNTRAVGQPSTTGFEVQGSTDPHVNIVLSSVVAATPEVLREVEALRSQEELKSRVRGEEGVGPDQTSRLLAESKQVRFSERTRYLDAGDCDLLTQLSANVFSRMDVKILRNASTCHRRSISMRTGQASLLVETLLPLKVAEAQPQ